MKDKQWKWEEQDEKQESLNWEDVNDSINDKPVRCTRSLSDVYERSNIVVYETVEFEEAIKNDKWIEAMKEELRMIEKNDTWMLVDKPLQKKITGVKWVYKTKLNVDGSINKYKVIDLFLSTFLIFCSF